MYYSYGFYLDDERLKHVDPPSGTFDTAAVYPPV